MYLQGMTYTYVRRPHIDATEGTHCGRSDDGDTLRVSFLDESLGLVLRNAFSYDGDDFKLRPTSKQKIKRERERVCICLKEYYMVQIHCR